MHWAGACGSPWGRGRRPLYSISGGAHLQGVQHGAGDGFGGTLHEPEAVRQRSPTLALPVGAQGHLGGPKRPACRRCRPLKVPFQLRVTCDPALCSVAPP